MKEDYKFMWEIVEDNGWERMPNETLFDTYVECYENMITEYPEYQKIARIYLVEVDETEVITLVKLLKTFN